MPRRARIRMPGQPFHIIQRGNNRTVCFYAGEDFKFYLHHLGILSQRYRVDIHAYVLMTNHVHLLMTGKHQDSLSDPIDTPLIQICQKNTACFVLAQGSP